MPETVEYISNILGRSYQRGYDPQNMLCGVRGQPGGTPGSSFICEVCGDGECSMEWGGNI